MPTIPTGRMELELRRLYVRWLSRLSDETNMDKAVDRFEKQSTDLIEKMGGRTAMLGALADFPAPKRLDLSPHIGTIYSDMKQAAIQAGIQAGLNASDVARAMFRNGMDKSYHRLNRLARTETVSAYWKNAWDSIADLPDIVMVWGAESGPRTCQWCLERDGMVMESSALRDHPNGRCTPIPTLRSTVEYKGSVDAGGRIYQDPAWTKNSPLVKRHSSPLGLEESYYSGDMAFMSEGSVFQENSVHQYLKTFTDVETEAVHSYTSGETFFNVRNAYQAGDKYPLSDGTNMFDVMDELFTRTQIPENTTLYRGMRVPKEWIDALIPGEDINHKFYISTTSDPGQATAFGAKKQKANVILKILTPQGTEVIPGAESLSEVVLRPETRMRIRRVAKLSNVTQVVVEAY